MADNFITSMSKTLGAWKEYIVPVAGMLMKGGLVTVEGKTDAELAGILDRLCGIDAFAVDGYYVQGVASRIQAVGTRKPFNTFTIRESRSTGAETELKKRIDAMKNGGLYPKLTLQAYVTEWTSGNLLSVAVCRTEDLYEFLENHVDKVIRRCTPDDYGGKTTFVCVPWDEMVNCGYVLRVLSQDGARTYNWENIMEPVTIESIVEKVEEPAEVNETLSYERFNGIPLSDVDISSGKCGLYTVVITPDDAEQLLILNTDNRAIKESVCQRYAQMMQAGQWDWCNGDDSKLMIGPGGVLRNGQHRLRAQIIANVTGVYDVRTGVPFESYKTMDSGSARKPSDYFAKKQYSPAASALAKSVYHAACGFHGLVSGTTRAVVNASDKLHQPTRVEIIDFTGENYDDLVSIVKLSQDIHNMIGKGSNAGIGTALYMLRSRGVDIDMFVSDIKSGENGCAQSLNVLFKNLNNKDSNRDQKWWAGIILIMANAWMDGKPIGVIRKNSLKSALDKEVDRFHAGYLFVNGRLHEVA